MGFLDKVKNLIGIEDEYYDEDYADDEYYDSTQVDTDAGVADTSYSVPEEEPVQKSYQEPRTSRRNNNVVSMAGGNPKMRIAIQEPLTYDDGPQILDDILDNKTVVLNLEMLEVDKKRQIFDFVNGGVYSLSGDIQKVAKDIFVIVPKGVEVDGKIKDTLQNKSLYQL